MLKLRGTQMSASLLLKIIGPKSNTIASKSLFVIFFFVCVKTKLTALWCCKSVQCGYTESNRLIENAPTEQRGPKSWSAGDRNPCLSRGLGLFASSCVNVK